ncbi:hypothetical protein [Methylobacter marinus]|uniref:hypothetical protein n=1 Tax=Methylobacter marinus TaxID=34058 RepID=UPI0003810900|nr:hypothetical protein [Methylobacter marinus]
MRVFDPEGNAHEKDPVDARECVQHCGYSYNPPAQDGAEGTDAKQGGPASGAPEAAGDGAVFEPLPDFDGETERVSEPVAKPGKKAK